MIELTQIKTTDTLSQLRGQLNTAFTEIQTDQPFVGRVINPSINIYNDVDSLSGSITASTLTTAYLCAECYPESNGILVTRVFGQLSFSLPSTVRLGTFCIDIPSVKLPTRTAGVSTFVTPSSLGLSPAAASLSEPSTNSGERLSDGVAMMKVGTGTVVPAAKYIKESANTCYVAIVPLPEASGKSYDDGTHITLYL